MATMHNALNQTITKSLIRELEAREQQLSALILRTPTGDIRNLQTDAHIHLVVAIDQLKKAQACDSQP